MGIVSCVPFHAKQSSHVEAMTLHRQYSVDQYNPLEDSHGPSQQLLEILAAANMAAVKVIESDTDFQKQIKANKFVLAIFMEEDTEIEV